jgi:Protein of unknown function (DUF992)
MMRKNIMMVAMGMLTLAAIPAQQALAAAAETSSGTKIGTLECKTVPHSGINLLIHSTVDVTCVFKSTAGEEEHYKGETGIGLGVDLAVKSNETLGYLVFASDFKKGTYKLAGKYLGGGGSATVGVGVGAQALVGGSNKSVSLQPLVLSSSEGIGVTGGVTYLYLQADKSADK